MTKAQIEQAKRDLAAYWAGSPSTSVERSMPKAKYVGPGAEAHYAALAKRAREVADEMAAEGYFADAETL